MFSIFLNIILSWLKNLDLGITVPAKSFDFLPLRRHDTNQLDSIFQLQIFYQLAVLTFLICLESMKRAMVEFEIDLTKMPLGKLSKSQIQKENRAFKFFMSHY